MSKIKIALEGPINGCMDKDCKTWRQKVVEELGYKYDFHNPMDFDCRGKEAEMEKELVAFDEVGIASSDILLVMADKAGWGTGMGVQMGYAMHKKIFVIYPHTDKPISPWLKNRADMVFPSLDDAIHYCHHYQPTGRS